MTGIFVAQQVEHVSMEVENDQSCFFSSLSISVDCWSTPKFRATCYTVALMKVSRVRDVTVLFNTVQNKVLLDRFQFTEMKKGLKPKDTINTMSSNGIVGNVGNP